MKHLSKDEVVSAPLSFLLEPCARWGGELCPDPFAPLDANIRTGVLITKFFPEANGNRICCLLRC